MILVPFHVVSVVCRTLTLKKMHILDDLQSRMREAGALMATEREEALASAARQIAEVEQQLGTAEMLRALVVAGIAQRWGIPEYDLPLRSIMPYSFSLDDSTFCRNRYIYY